MLSQLKKLVRGAAGCAMRHVVQNSLLCLPGSKWIQARRGITTGAMNRPDTMCGWARQVIDEARRGGIDIAGARLVEVGPGHSLGVAAALLLAGAAEVAALDIQPFADPTNAEPLRPVAEQCQREGLARTTALDDALKRLRYAIVSTSGQWPLPDGSADIVYSYFSGEHLRSPREVLAESRRVLRPGGLCMHAVDLRDHIHRDGNWLKFLYYESWLWDAMTSRRGHWSNRILSPQWRGLFSEYFMVQTFNESRHPTPADFDRERLASPFRWFDVDTLRVQHLWVVGKKEVGGPAENEE